MKKNNIILALLFSFFFIKNTFAVYDYNLNNYINGGTQKTYNYEFWHSNSAVGGIYTQNLNLSNNIDAENSVFYLNSINCTTPNFLENTSTYMSIQLDKSFDGLNINNGNSTYINEAKYFYNFSYSPNETITIKRLSNNNGKPFYTSVVIIRCSLKGIEYINGLPTPTVPNVPTVENKNIYKDVKDFGVAIFSLLLAFLAFWVPLKYAFILSKNFGKKTIYLFFNKKKNENN